MFGIDPGPYGSNAVIVTTRPIIVQTIQEVDGWGEVKSDI